VYLFILLPRNVAPLPHFADSYGLHVLFPSTIPSFGMSLFLVVLACLWAVPRELASPGAACRKINLSDSNMSVAHNISANNRTSSGNILFTTTPSSVPILRVLPNAALVNPQPRNSLHTTSPILNGSPSFPFSRTPTSHATSPSGR
jgi:hypothetical protein